MIIWPCALIFLSLLDTQTHHWSLCPLNNLGFEHCWGCGLGRSISFLFHGEFAQSFETHPLGSFAVIVLVYRTFYLAHLSLKEFSNKRHQL